MVSRKSSRSKTCPPILNHPAGAYKNDDMNSNSHQIVPKYKICFINVMVAYIYMIVYESDNNLVEIPPGQLQPSSQWCRPTPHLLKSRTYQLIQHRPRTPMKNKLLNKSTWDLEHTHKFGAFNLNLKMSRKNLEKANHLHNNIELLGVPWWVFRKCTPFVHELKCVFGWIPHVFSCQSTQTFPKDRKSTLKRKCGPSWMAGYHEWI